MSGCLLQNASLTVRGATLLRDVNFSVNRGACVGLVGPNGAGKSTAMRAMLGLAHLSAGAASVDGRDVRALSASARAAIIAYLPQSRGLAWPISVRDAVAIGRHAKGANEEAVEHAMRSVGIEHLAKANTARLSGGERARVHLARALAAQTPFLFADEPTASLDPLQALNVMQIIHAHARGGGGALVIVHDLMLAARFCDSIVLLKEGGVAAAGPPHEVLAPPVLTEVFGVAMQVGADGVRYPL